MRNTFITFAPNMNNNTIHIRQATPDDAAAIRSIYAPYVEQTALTYDTIVPTEEFFRQSIAELSQEFPYLVATDSDGRIIGYSYAHKFIPRPAANHSVETTIYVERTDRRTGVGRALYEELERLLREQGRRNLYAKVTWTNQATPYLTNASSYFHERMGYVKAAHLHDCGYKFGQYFDTLIFEKRL